MILTTIHNMGGYNYEVIGLVTGSMVSSKNMFKDFGAGLKSMVGGELKSYTAMMQEARQAATDRMVAEAQSMGADAILGVSYSTSSIIQGAAEVLATGTAVRFV